MAFDQALAILKQVRTPEGTIRTSQFLMGCRLVLPIVEKMGAGFAIVKSDVGGNIDRLSARAAIQQEAYESDIFQIVRDEVAEGTQGGSSSCTKGLLWLKRAMEFIVAVLRRLHDDRESSLSQIASDTYYETLQKYHGWLVTGTFTVALKLVPSRESFFEKLEMDPSDAASWDKMGAFCAKFSDLLAQAHQFLDSNGLDDPTKV